MRREKTRVRIFGDARACDEMAMGKRMDCSLQSFTKLPRLLELNSANARRSRFHKGGKRESVMQQDFVHLLLALAGASFDDKMKAARECLARRHPGADTGSFRRRIDLQKNGFAGGVIENSKRLLAQGRLMTSDRLQIKIWQQNRSKHWHT